MSDDSLKNSCRPIPGEILKPVVKERPADQRQRAPEGWSPFLFRFYASLSLRRVIDNFALIDHERIHYGLCYVPGRINLTDGNAERNGKVFGKLYDLAGTCHSKCFHSRTYS